MKLLRKCNHLGYSNTSSSKSSTLSSERNEPSLDPLQQVEEEKAAVQPPHLLSEDTKEKNDNNGEHLTMMQQKNWSHINKGAQDQRKDTNEEGPTPPQQQCAGPKNLLKNTTTSVVGRQETTVSSPSRTILFLNEYDVLLGRGNGANNTRGNIFFRYLVWDAKEEYTKASNHNKVQIAQRRILNVIHSLGGRFLERHQNRTNNKCENKKQEKQPNEKNEKRGECKTQIQQQKRSVDNTQVEHGCESAPGRCLDTTTEDCFYLRVSTGRAIEKACQALRERNQGMPPKGYESFCVDDHLKKAKGGNCVKQHVKCSPNKETTMKKDNEGTQQEQRQHDEAKLKMIERDNNHKKGVRSRPMGLWLPSSSWNETTTTTENKLAQQGGQKHQEVQKISKRRKMNSACDNEEKNQNNKQDKTERNKNKNNDYHHDHCMNHNHNTTSYYYHHPGNPNLRPHSLITDNHQDTNQDENNRNSTNDAMGSATTTTMMIATVDNMVEEGNRHKNNVNVGWFLASNGTNNNNHSQSSIGSACCCPFSCCPPLGHEHCHCVLHQRNHPGQPSLLPFDLQLFNL